MRILDKGVDQTEPRYIGKLASRPKTITSHNQKEKEDQADAMLRCARPPKKNDIPLGTEFFHGGTLARRVLCLPGRFAAQKTTNEPGVVPLARSRLPGLREWAPPLFSGSSSRTLELFLHLILGLAPGPLG